MMMQTMEEKRKVQEECQRRDAFAAVQEARTEYEVAVHRCETCNSATLIGPQTYIRRPPDDDGEHETEQQIDLRLAKVCLEAAERRHAKALRNLEAAIWPLRRPDYRAVKGSPSATAEAAS